MNHLRSALSLPAWVLVTSVVVAGCAVESAEPADVGATDPSAEEIQLRNETADELAAGKADNGRCSGVLVPDRTGFEKRIALTFDDGPHRTLTPKVLDILDQFHAKAVFFEMGKNMVGNEDIMQEVLDRGHLIGNHTYSHPNMRSISHSAAVSQIEKTIEVVKSARLRAPGASGYYTMRFMRFPYGASNCDTADIVKSHGEIISGWHIDSADWCFGARTDGVGYCSPRTFGDSSLTGYRDDIVSYVVHQAERRGGGVLLFHDVHAYTVQVLPKILQALVDDGFTFVRLDDKDTFPLLNGVDPAEKPWIGSKCTTQADCDFPVGEGKSAFCAIPEGSTEGFCSMSCEGYCPDRYGAAPTFCTSLDGGNTGVCVSKSSSLNHDCADVPGTEPVPVDRFVGSSSAPAKTATACVPTSNGTPQYGSCTVTVHGGTSAFKAPSFSADKWGVLPEGTTYERLDGELYNGAFIRVDPKLAGTDEAYVWEDRVSCQ